MVTEFAPAKINLTLQVTGRRPDGYHLLDSLVVFAAAGDVLTAENSDDLTLTLSGPFAGALAPEPDNLVLRAARALALEAGRPARGRLHLEKRLPVASGIGGGSSDAAATLRALCRLWDVPLPRERLLAVAATLGADVPVCLHPGAYRMAGVGEHLTPAPRLPRCGILLANPGAALATGDVFAARTGGFSEPGAWPGGWDNADALAASLAEGANDLQAPAISLCPAIGDVLARLAALPGALLSRMSGSGATCFALFATPDQACRAADTLVPVAWWRWGGPLYEHAADT